MRDRAVERWTQVVVEAPPRIEHAPPGEEPDLGRAQAVYHSQKATFQKDKRGGQVFLAVRLGIIDIAFPAAAALFVWPNIKDRLRVLDTLVGNGGFGPYAITKLVSTGPRFAEAVGRGLAYNAVHEFWHASERRSGHPYNMGNNFIEGNPSPLKNDLVFQAPAVKNILSEYEKTWCGGIQKGIKGLSEV
jgi:hypothetical protein